MFAALTLNSPFAKATAGERTLDTFTTCPGGGTLVRTGGPCTIGLPAASNGSPQYGLDPRAATPYSLQFNVSVGQQLFKDTVVEVGYVGNRARNQLTHYDINQVLPQNRVAAAFAANANAANLFRPFTNYGAIYIFERAGRADYDSLQVLFRTRFTQSLSLQAAYTFSRSVADFGLSDSNGNRSDFAVLNNADRDLDMAESDINRPHIFVANFIYCLGRMGICRYRSAAKRPFDHPEFERHRSARLAGGDCVPGRRHRTRHGRSESTPAAR